MNGDHNPSADGSEATNTPSNHLELFVKAGHDGIGYGACPFCQRMFMILLLKANAGELTFTVTTVNMAKPPVDFKKLSSRLPVVVHDNEVLSDGDEIVNYLDANFLTPDLRYNNRTATEACLGAFSKFTYYIKEVSHSPSQLVSEIRKINDYLEESETKFLCGDEMCHLDCLILPKLHHIRVAAKAFKDFNIPPEFTVFWRYMNNAYGSDVFRKTCPTDQEIVHHWACKRDVPKLPKDVGAAYSPDSKPVYSFNVPLNLEPEPYGI